ncbi:hypothetical protein [Serinibacter salmoneus]|uniref:Alternate signal-mediated exported protein n=1 Tax=Serinibacter salmoneus TaxID=556530 RepID=A0A2A9CY28_9MICO|nr:hypothetical protein [Serinibacter salmoneus]PFG19051.1 alternate signal-mediated exported protein [Serinibacter salmoneus]
MTDHDAVAAPRRRNWALPAALAGALLLGLSTGGTYATLWQREAAVSNTHLQAGALGVVATGTPVWRDGLGVIDPATYPVRPGDTLTVEQAYQITREGTNLNVEPTLTLGEPLPAGVTATYTLSVDAGAPTEPTAVGSPSDILSSGIGADVLPVTAVVTLTIGGTAAAGGSAAVEIPEIALEVQQVRAGAGYTS